MKKIAVGIVIVAVGMMAGAIVLLFNPLSPISQDESIAQQASEATQSASYVPGSKCKACHLKQFKAQAETAHAKSFENLIDAGEEKNADCYKCHTTGHGEPGGFVDTATTPDLVGTTCQACHGPGSEHIAHGLSKEQRRETIQKPPKDVCTKCHKTHEAHPDIGAKSLPSLKKKLEGIQNRIKALEG